MWSERGAWQVSSAVSGYKSTQIDDRGDIMFEGELWWYVRGPIFNSTGELVGINYASGSSLSLELDDYQDPHSTYYNPVVAPDQINIIGVDVAGIRDLIDENSIYFDNHVSSNSSVEIEYFLDKSENIFSITRNEENSAIKFSQIKDYEFKFIKDIDVNIESSYSWAYFMLKMIGG